MIRLAEFDSTKKYRYSLDRYWSAGNFNFKTATFIGLNPSTANENVDDPTIRRCISFAKSWGLDGMRVVNLFSFRATNPKDLMKEKHPVGIITDGYIAGNCCCSKIVVACWGNNGEHRGRDKEVIKLVKKCVKTIYCFGTTKSGHPRHPLYLRKDTPLVKYDC